MSKQQNIATKRTTINNIWLAIILVVGSRILKLDMNAPDIRALTVPAVAVFSGIWYRLSRYLADQHPTLGKILFGTTDEPVYVDPQSDG